MSRLDEFIGTDLAFKGDFVPSATGDLELISGLENLKQALFRRLLTTPGAIVHRPEFGVNIKAFQGALNSLENQRRLARTIKEQFEQDPRVEQVTGVSFASADNKPDQVEVKVRVSVAGYGETTFGFIPFGDV